MTVAGVLLLTRSDRVATPVRPGDGPATPSSRGRRIARQGWRGKKKSSFFDFFLAMGVQRSRVERILRVIVGGAQRAGRAVCGRHAVAHPPSIVTDYIESTLIIRKRRYGEVRCATHRRRLVRRPHRTTALPRCVVNSLPVENIGGVGMHWALAAHFGDSPALAVAVYDQRDCVTRPSRPGVTRDPGAERAVSK